VSQKTNEKEARCEDCQGLVPPGQGSLWREAGPDDGGDVVGRTPAGWRVTHLDSAVCTAEKAATAAARAADREKALEATRIVEVPCRLEPWQGKPGVHVRHEVCTPPARLAGVRQREILDRTVYPASGGFSRGMQGMVTEFADGIVASYGSNEGSGTQWASPALVERGLQQYRIAQWWSPVGYGAESYPGPGVPESDLTEEERAQVTRLRAAATAERMERERRSVLSSVDHVFRTDRAFAGATWTVELDETGRKRAGKATARPPYTTTVKVHNQLSATVEVTEVA
jgi:hypothetical protein